MADDKETTAKDKGAWLKDAIEWLWEHKTEAGGLLASLLVSGSTPYFDILPVPGDLVRRAAICAIIVGFITTLITVGLGAFAGRWGPWYRRGLFLVLAAVIAGASFWFEAEFKELERRWKTVDASEFEAIYDAEVRMAGCYFACIGAAVASVGLAICDVVAKEKKAK